MARWWMVLVVTLLSVNSSVGNSTTAVPETHNDPDWWKNCLIYQIYPRSFKDSDGDGVGDLNGITSKLDYVADTGANAIWLSPIFKSPMVDFGYDISDYKSIDPIFGTMGDFEKLMKKAKEKGIKVLLDFVPNHSSDQHEWFQKSAMNDTKYKDYYIWANGRLLENTYELLPPNNWLSVFGGSAWTWSEDRQQFYLHQFTSAQPDFNNRNPDVFKDIEDVMTFWLDKGVDGFRVDAVSHLYEVQDLSHEKRSNDPDARPGNYSALSHNFTFNRIENHGLVLQWRKLMDNYTRSKGNTRIIFTESGGSIKDVLAYYGDKTNPEAHFPFNFELINKITNNSKAPDYKKIIETWPASQQRNWVIGNHDQNRVATRLGRDMVDFMNMLVLLLPGTAITYNGEEIGMEDTPITWEQVKDPRGINAGKRKYAQFTRDPQRTPFQWDATDNAGFSKNTSTWLPVNPNYMELNLQSQVKATKSHYNTYKRLAEARKEPAIQRGSLNILAPDNDTFTFTRELDGSDAFVVVVNLGTSLKKVDFSIYKNLKGNFTVYAVSTNSPLDVGSYVSKELMLNPREAVVLTTSIHTAEPHSSKKSSATTLTNNSVTVLVTVACVVLSRYMFLA